MIDGVAGLGHACRLGDGLQLSLRSGTPCLAVLYHSPSLSRGRLLGGPTCRIYHATFAKFSCAMMMVNLLVGSLDGASTSNLLYQQEGQLC